MKACKDCKYARRNWFFGIMAPFGKDQWDFAKCSHPESYSNITEQSHLGKLPEKQGRFYCSTMRKFKCGSEARLFEAKNE